MSPCAVYTVTGSPGDETITACSSVVVGPDGRALASHPDTGDVLYPSLDDLLSDYTIGRSDLEPNQALEAVWTEVDWREAVAKVRPLA